MKYLKKDFPDFEVSKMDKLVNHGYIAKPTHLMNNYKVFDNQAFTYHSTGPSTKTDEIQKIFDKLLSRYIKEAKKLLNPIGPNLAELVGQIRRSRGMQAEWVD